MIGRQRRDPSEPKRPRKDSEEGDGLVGGMREVVQVIGNNAGT